MVFHWHQVLNAITMVSPLWVWMHRRKTHSHVKFHKFLKYHIPCSITYHLTQCFFTNSVLARFLKLCDCIMVHIHASLCNIDIITYNNIKISLPESVVRKSAYSLNYLCIVRMIRQPRIIDNVVFSVERIIAMGVLSCSTLTHTNQMRNGAIIGASSAALYIADNALAQLGHPCFHILLGLLHQTSYNCINVK